MKRILHALQGHSFRVMSAAFNKPVSVTINCAEPSNGVKELIWGFTEILMQCDCGKNESVRLIGDHSAVKSLAEIKELERIGAL